MRNAGGTQLVRVTDVDRDLGGFWYLFNGRGFENGYDASNFILSGNDSFVAGPGGFDFALGAGNDRFAGSVKEDFVDPGAGSDTLSGGTNIDTLSYNEATYDASAFRGVSLDAQSGIAADPYGFTDRFRNFESFQGTRFRDALLGSDADEVFIANRGRDTIDGRGGADCIDYANEHADGGRFGIRANLLAGRVVDAYATVDTVANIEHVRGSRFADAIVGSGADNQVAGLDGADTIDGAAGLGDTLRYDWDPQFGGNASVAVSLQVTRRGAQILGTATDGFGRTDTLRNIENVWGSDAGNDRIGGSLAANTLEGRDGADVLSGFAGDDTLVGGNGRDRLAGGFGADVFAFQALAHAGDAIADFVSGTDRLVFASAGFGGVDDITPQNFIQNAAGRATTVNHRFVFETDTARLFFDANGSTAGASVLIATLQGVRLLSPDDFAF